MQERLDIFTFVDALGWELASEHGVLARACAHRLPLESVLGYSCACIPTILTGLRPEGHGHFAFYQYRPESSPFRGLEWLDVLPRALSSRGRPRGWLSRLVRAWLGYTGYFSLYNVPFRYLPLLDYAEKRDLYRPGGIASGASTIFDDLDAAGVPYLISDWRAGELANFEALDRAVRAGNIRAAYLYLADLDAILHRSGTGSAEVRAKLAGYDTRLTGLLDLARTRYSDVRLHVFSDHGMADVTRLVDVEGQLAARGFRQGREYFGVFDSTMARLWVLSERAAEPLAAALREMPGGRLLDAADLARFGCRFPGLEYGELIYLVEPGTMVFPNFMGAQPAAGMHGYHPAHPRSLASYLGTHAPPVPLAGLWDLRGLMRTACEVAS